MEDGKGGILSRDAIIGLDLYWGVKLFFYTDGDLIYRCCNEKQNAATSDADWAIWKLSYTGGDITMIEGPLTGVCDDKADLDWRA